MMLATLIQPRASSSATRQYSNAPSPAPPYSSGIVMPKNPSSPIWSISDCGIDPFFGSSSLATGRTSLSVNSRAIRLSISRSGVM